MEKARITQSVDPKTLSVVLNRIHYITEQLGEKILYSSQSFVTALVRDLGQTFLTKDGTLVDAATYLTIHTIVAEEAIKGLESYFHGDYEPGDFIVANDPYIVKGGHLPDWNFVRPVFYKGEHIGFLQAKTHVADTGGFTPGGYAPGAYDIVAEGLNIPPLKVMKKGVLQKEVWGFLLRNVRNSPQVDMDTMLISGCMALAEEQIVALCDKYGVETVKSCMEQIIALGEKAMRAAIAEIPDGTYYGEAATDWDGKTDKPVWVRVDVTIKGDEITFDYSKSDPQATFVNCPEGVVWTNSLIPLYFMLDPSIPKSGGTRAPVRIIAPEGSVVNPIYPATVGASQISVGMQIVDAILMALGKALPERAMGGWCKHFSPMYIGVDPSMIDPRTGLPRQYLGETFASDAGSGAVKGFDGWHGVNFIGTAGNFMKPSLEFFEISVPHMVTQLSILQDWEGAGEFRGSPGVYCESLACSVPEAPTFLMTGNCDGQRFAPPGVVGGGSAPLSEMTIIGTDGKSRIMRTMDFKPIASGERVITKCSGGGGWGDPLNRDVHKVQDDVMDGLVSIERARDVYGVVMNPETFEIDSKATEKLRTDMKKKKGS